MNPDLLRLVDVIHRDKEIDKEIIFSGIEQCLLSAARKNLGTVDDIDVTIDRESGDIKITRDGNALNPKMLGRISALTGKQVLIQKIKEAESNTIFEEYSEKLGQVVTGQVQRFEGPNVIVNLGKTEGILPRRQQIPGETYQPGERLKLFITEVKKSGQKVKIMLSRAHADFIRALFEIEVPEIAESIIEIKSLAREPGYRTKIAVVSLDPKIDCVGACVGVRGARIRSIVDELNGEKIDIIKWSDSPEVLIMNALKPAEINSITLDYENSKAQVIVDESQLSLAIGKRGQNVRLAAKLSGYDLDIVSPEKIAAGEAIDIGLLDEEDLAKKPEEKLTAETLFGPDEENTSQEAPATPAAETEENPEQNPDTEEETTESEPAEEIPADNEEEKKTGEGQNDDSPKPDEEKLQDAPAVSDTETGDET
ncbi:MAG: transcription termination factor NusA [Planctomycetota bacterium]|jgi:N utilization substance protein A